MYQNNENKRIQLKLNGKMKEIHVIQEDLCNTVQVLQNELMDKDSEIHSMKQEQELQELKLRKGLWMKEATERFIEKSDTNLWIGWLNEKFTLVFDWEAKQRKVEAQRKISELEELAHPKKEIDTESIMTKIDMKSIITNIMEISW